MVWSIGLMEAVTFIPIGSLGGILINIEFLRAYLTAERLSTSQFAVESSEHSIALRIFPLHASP